MVVTRCIAPRFRVRKSFSTKTAEYRIQQAGVFVPPEYTSGFDGLLYRRMILYARIRQLEQAHSDQCIDDTVALLQRPVEQFVDPFLDVPVMPQRAKTKHAQQRAIIACNPGLGRGERHIERTTLAHNVVNRLCGDRAYSCALLVG